jgi:hypothetical protein
MKQDQILEKVRNSFRDAAKKVPRKQQSLLSKSTISKTIKKSSSGNDEVDSCDYDESVCDSADQSLPPSYARLSSLNNTPSHAAMDSDDDNRVRFSPDVMLSGVSNRVFLDRASYNHHRNCEVRHMLNSSLIQSEPNVFSRPNIQQTCSPNSSENSNSHISPNHSSKATEVETLEDLLFAVDSALHWKSSSSTASKSFDDVEKNSQNLSSKPKASTTTTRLDGGKEKGNSSNVKSNADGLDSDESNDSFFIGMIEQTLGPLNVDDEKKSSTTVLKLKSSQPE